LPTPKSSTSTQPADGTLFRVAFSLAVVLGAIGVMLGFPLADPIIGIIISAAIIVLLWGTIRNIRQRLTLHAAEHNAEHALPQPRRPRAPRGRHNRTPSPLKVQRVGPA